MNRATRHARDARRHAVPRWGLTVLIGLVAVAVLAGGVAVGRHLAEGSPQPSSSPARDTAAAPAPTPVPAPPPPAPHRGPDTSGLEAEFAALAAELDARVGLVVHALGTGAPPVSLGDWSVGPAWSTIKVPLAIAGLRSSEPPSVTDAMRAAITRSDNAAAESIWQGLGDPRAAASRVQEVLAQTGDPTVVESQKIRPEFTAFGQTQWSLDHQAMFLAVAACDTSNEPILSLMSEIAGDQRWGLGTIAGVKFKGGWGPSPEGAYLVRQMGIVPTPAGQAVVTVAVEPASGAFGDGTQVLTRVAEWLTERADLLPAGTCAQ